MQALAEITRAKVELLTRTSHSFVEAVAATAHLDQKALVCQDLLPREVDGFRKVSWELLCRRWGLHVMGDLHAEFFAIEVPSGWRLQPVAHDSLWSLILDEQGRERASVYYQANAAILYLHHRYNIFSHYLDPTDPTVRIISARDERRIFREFGRIYSDEILYFQEVHRVEMQAHDWFDSEYPGWRSPFAYWDLVP